MPRMSGLLLLAAAYDDKVDSAAHDGHDRTLRMVVVGHTGDRECRFHVVVCEPVDLVRLPGGHSAVAAGPRRARHPCRERDVAALEGRRLRARDLGARRADLDPRRARTSRLPGLHGCGRQEGARGRGEHRHRLHGAAERVRHQHLAGCRDDHADDHQDGHSNIHDHHHADKHHHIRHRHDRHRDDDHHDDETPRRSQRRRVRHARRARRPRGRRGRRGPRRGPRRGLCIHGSPLGLPRAVAGQEVAGRGHRGAQREHLGHRRELQQHHLGRRRGHGLGRRLPRRARQDRHSESGGREPVAAGFLRVLGR
mmetsp:Transcript_66967/g.217940  ORF Transcript_66967/g.217940 Transcript_66967/m.217940 type:complete len:310 (+) Transcript_66967:2283-3212(+)